MNSEAGISAAEGWWLFVHSFGRDMAVEAEKVQRVELFPGPSNILVLPRRHNGCGTAVVLNGRPVMMVDTALLMGGRKNDGADNSDPSLCVLLKHNGWELALPAKEVAGPYGLSIIKDHESDKLISGLGVIENRQVEILDVEVLVKTIGYRLRQGSQKKSSENG
ncbi:MAG: hypothetical protein GXP49_03110 [Deltaproteobacteria bacterium]|nr:hypothetical protein [Deltaproteobacteria bacterium]